MSVFRTIESKIEGLFEGVFGRAFRTHVQPIELARKLAKEMDDHRTVSLSRTYVPNEYLIYLGPQDRERYEGVEHEVLDELAGYLMEHARRERLALVSRPKIEFRTDEQLALGEFGIQARTVRPAAGGAVQQADVPALLARLGVILVIGVAADYLLFGLLDRRMRRRRGLIVESA